MQSRLATAKAQRSKLGQDDQDPRNGLTEVLSWLRPTSVPSSMRDENFIATSAMLSRGNSYEPVFSNGQRVPNPMTQTNQDRTSPSRFVVDSSARHVTISSQWKKARHPAELSSLVENGVSALPNRRRPIRVVAGRSTMLAISGSNPRSARQNKARVSVERRAASYTRQPRTPRRSDDSPLQR